MFLMVFIARKPLNSLSPKGKDDFGYGRAYFEIPLFAIELVIERMAGWLEHVHLESRSPMNAR
jgi:hypothetical protein